MNRMYIFRARYRKYIYILHKRTQVCGYLTKLRQPTVMRGLFSTAVVLLSLSFQKEGSLSMVEAHKVCRSAFLRVEFMSL